MQYAVCPECDNPVQIIGLYLITADTRYPYAKHVMHDVAEIAKYNQEAYVWCPLRRRTRLLKTSKKNNPAGLPAEIKNLLRDQFDRAVYILARDTDVKFSENLLRKMLRSYMGERGHLYVGATLNNLPWIFGYMSDAQPLYGQLIVKGSPLHEAIVKNCEDAVMKERTEPADNQRFVQVSSKPGCFLDIGFCFIKHKVTTDEKESAETLEFQVFTGTPPETQLHYKKLIHIDGMYFQKLMSLPPEKSHRNKKQLDIAAEVLK